MTLKTTERTMKTTMVTKMTTTGDEDSVSVGWRSRIRVWDIGGLEKMSNFFSFFFFLFFELGLGFYDLLGIFSSSDTMLIVHQRL